MTTAELERIAMLTYYLLDGNLEVHENYELTNLVRQFKTEKDKEKVYDNRETE